MKDKLKILFILFIACLCFIFIDHVSAVSLDIQVQSGSCNIKYLGIEPFGDLVFYGSFECSANSSFVILYYPVNYDAQNGLTTISSVALRDNNNSISYRQSNTTSVIYQNFSYYDLSQHYAFGLKSKHTEAIYWNKGSLGSIHTSIINITNAGTYDFVGQFTVLDGNQVPIVQSAYDSAKTDQKLDDVNQSIDDVNDSITSTDPPELGSLGDTAGWLPAGPVDSILNLPLTMFNNLSTSIGSSCQPVTLTLPFVKKNLELPCLSSIYAKIDGLSIWINSIGIIASAFILYSYLLNLYKFVDDTLTMRENTWNDVDQWGGI